MTIAITGHHDELPKTLNGRSVEWLQIPVLRFEKIDVSSGSNYDWLVFSSRQGVKFWSSRPVIGKVACVGEKTAKAANEKGMNVAFFPKTPGSEGFLKEFVESHEVAGKRFLIAGAEKGRQEIFEKLKSLGAAVEFLPLYRSVPLEGVSLPQKLDALVFTSPSSVEAVEKNGGIPKTKLFALGSFTAQALRKRGTTTFKEIPGGILPRLGEVL